MPEYTQRQSDEDEDDEGVCRGQEKSRIAQFDVEDNAVLLTARASMLFEALDDSHERPTGASGFA